MHSFSTKGVFCIYCCLNQFAWKEEKYFLPPPYGDDNDDDDDSFIGISSTMSTLDLAVWLLLG